MPISKKLCQQPYYTFLQVRGPYMPEHSLINSNCSLKRRTTFFALKSSYRHTKTHQKQWHQLPPKKDCVTYGPLCWYFAGSVWQTSRAMCTVIGLLVVRMRRMIAGSGDAVYVRLVTGTPRNNIYTRLTRVRQLEYDRWMLILIIVSSYIRSIPNLWSLLVVYDTWLIYC